MAAAELPVQEPLPPNASTAIAASGAPEETGSAGLIAGEGASPARGPAMGPVAQLEDREYTAEEIDQLEQANQPKGYTQDEVDKMVVAAFDDPNYVPTRDEYFDQKATKERLKAQGKIPGNAELAAKAVGGLFVSAFDAFNTALYSPAESLAKSPATMQTGIGRAALGAMQLGGWVKQALDGQPQYINEATGEFLFAEAQNPMILAGFQERYPNQPIRATNEEDLKDYEFKNHIQEKGIDAEYQDLATKTAPTELLTRVLTGRNQQEAPNLSQAGVIEMVADPTNLIPFGAGAKTIGLSRLGKVASSKAAGAIEFAAGGLVKGNDALAERFANVVTNATGFTPRDISAAGKVINFGKNVGIGGGIAAGAAAVGAPPEVAATIAGFYPVYKAGFGVLRKIETGAGTAKIILRESADATNGLDQAARAAVLANPSVPQAFKEVLERPSQFVSIESTPARLAANQALSPQMRALASKLSNPAIVQAVRGSSALATGAVKGAAVNAPFALLAANAGDDEEAAAILGAGAAFGAAGAGVERFTGLQQRRQQAAISDVSRMLVDVELNGGDVGKMMSTQTPDSLVKLAAMQGTFRNALDFVPLNAIDYEKNVSSNGGSGAAGLFLQAAPGQRAKVYINLDAKRTGVEPHEFGHALLSSGALDGQQKFAARAWVDKTYGLDGIKARAAEYASSIIRGKNSEAFPDGNFEITPPTLSSEMENLSQGGLARGDMDGLDWARDEIFAETFAQASQTMDFAAIRRGAPAGENFLTFAEGILGAQARALTASGIRIDGQTGRPLDTPGSLFKENPLLATDKALLGQLGTYINNYRQWANNPTHEKPAGVKIAPSGRASDLANNPQVTFYDRGDGVKANAFAIQDPVTGQAILRDQRDLNAEHKKVREQLKALGGSKLRPENDPYLGPRKDKDSNNTRIRGKLLPQQFDFLNGFMPHIRNFARQFEQFGQTGESMQVRYHAIGSGDSGAFQVKKLGNLEAITREVLPFEWQLTKAGNLNAVLLDLTQFRNRAMRGINNRSEFLAPFNFEMSQIETDLKQWMDNHRNNLPGENKIGIDKRNALNALIGIGTNYNRGKNPLNGAFGPGSAIKQFRLDRVDAAIGTGRQGFHFDYEKANGNLLPNIPAAMPDLSKDLPGQGMPDLDPIEDSARKIHAVYDQSLLAKDRDTALYPQNPVKGSVVLPPRYGLVGNAPGMPKNFTEVRELVKLLADRVQDTGLRETEFAQKSARFYSDMASEAVSLAEIIDPQITGIERFNRADEMLRYLALGSPRTNVPVNSTKSAGAAAAALGNFTAGYKMGFGELQRATRQTQTDFNAGKHFDMEIKGVQDKVRTFYINGLSELIDLARKNGDTTAVEMLQTRAAKSLKLIDPNASNITPQQLAETERILDGKATIDMWDMAAKRVAVPGFILDPKKRADLKQPFEWTQKNKAAKDTIGSPRWAKVAKELAINSPAELRYQQARTLGIEGNFDWTAETWKARVDSKAPFAGADFTTYTASTEAGLSPGGGGRLYDAQQAIDGMLADELNRRGLASMFGKQKLFARNAQEILWAIEKKDNPILANNDLSLFSDSIQPLKQELQAIAGTGGQRNARGAQVLDAMERAYTAMARQEMPFEVATVGTGRTATAINSAIATMEQAGDKQALARLTAHFANNLADELTGLATQHGIKLQVDSVKTDLGGFTMNDGVYTETPQITAVIRGDRGDTKYLMQVVNEAVEQQGGNIFRRPSAKELYDPAVEKQPVVSFETGQMTTAQRTAFVTDLAKIRDSNGNRIFTGYTPSDKGVFIGGQFYDGNFMQAVNGNQAAIQAVMANHGVTVSVSENMIVPSYRSSDPVTPSAFRDAVQKLFYDKAVSGIAANAPTSVIQPANVEANLKSRLKKNETMFIGREELDALAKAITESENMSADQALVRAGQSMEIPGTKKMQAAFADYVRGKKTKFEALPAEDKKVVSGYIKQARETAKTLRDQEVAFSKAAKDGIRKRRAEIADRYDPQRALDEIDAANLLGYMEGSEVAP